MTKSGKGEYPFYRVFDGKRYYYQSHHPQNQSRANSEAEDLRARGYKVRITKEKNAVPSPDFVLWILGLGIKVGRSGVVVGRPR